MKLAEGRMRRTEMGCSSRIKPAVALSVVIFVLILHLVNLVQAATEVNITDVGQTVGEAFVSTTSVIEKEINKTSPEMIVMLSSGNRTTRRPRSKFERSTNVELDNAEDGAFSSLNGTTLMTNNQTSNFGNKLTKQQLLQHQAFQKRLMELKQKYMTNRAIGDKAYYILLAIYSLFIAVGTISNSLICLTVSIC